MISRNSKVGGDRPSRLEVRIAIFFARVSRPFLFP
jgi:hypothetical protein